MAQMGVKKLVRSPGRVTLAALLAGAVVLLMMAGPAANAGAAGTLEHGKIYRQVNLISDVPGLAAVTDPNLVNPWGMAASPTSPVWVSDNGTDVTTLYAGGAQQMPFGPVPLVVNIPGGAPTGQVFNGSNGFVVHSGSDSGPALFMFASESGMITGWNPAVPLPPPSTEAQVAVSTPGAVYKGLALATAERGEPGEEGQRLYAANFSAGTIDVFDSSFNPVHRPGAFVDRRLPDGYAPFNIQRLHGRLYVTYAKQDEAKEDDVPGSGHGFVDVYNPEGRLLRRLVARGPLDSPWGLTIAPRDFGGFGDDLLVGNFGNGKIHAFDPRSGEFLGTLTDKNHVAIAIDGLWGLRFGNGVAGGIHTLLFTAGPDGEAHGLLGAIHHVEH
jgi:uncharacterized protein (TIGR03118 family)